MTEGPPRHPVEIELGASARDILDAIAAGFRAKIDVKGKLAELYLARQFESLRLSGAIGGFRWNDRDGLPDFSVSLEGADVVMECKNVRSPSAKEVAKPGTIRKPRVELQKTRNSKDGAPTRGYSVGEFDALAVALYNQTGRWEYVHCLTSDLARRPKDPGRLEVMQPVPLQPSGIWKGSLLDVLKAAAAEKRAKR